MKQAVAAPEHTSKSHPAETAQRLNWLRAGVLGANDGIVSVAAVVVGVAGVTAQSGPILTAGTAALVGGAISMALGEYVSVSSQRDSQEKMIADKRRDLLDNPVENRVKLAKIYEDKGLSSETATLVAAELSEKDALGSHLSAELNLEADDVVSPWHAAIASAIAFTLGAILPMLAILLPSQNTRVPVTFGVVLLALAATGWIGAAIGGSSRSRAAVRVVIGGALALATTYAIGSLLGASGMAG